MPRKSEGPHYYELKQPWVANINKERIVLLKGPKEETEEQAWEKYRQERAARSVEQAGDRADNQR